jgi:hypothetical protein
MDKEKGKKWEHTHFSGGGGSCMGVEMGVFSISIIANGASGIGDTALSINCCSPASPDGSVDFPALFPNLNDFIGTFHEIFFFHSTGLSSFFAGTKRRRKRGMRGERKERYVNNRQKLCTADEKFDLNSWERDEKASVDIHSYLFREREKLKGTEKISMYTRESDVKPLRIHFEERLIEIQEIKEDRARERERKELVRAKEDDGKYENAKYVVHYDTRWYRYSFSFLLFSRSLALSLAFSNAAHAL